MRVNQKGTSKVPQKNQRTVNYEGGPAFHLGLKERLVSRVLTSFYNEEGFYDNTTKAMLNDAKALMDKDPLFVAKLAVYARLVMNLRTTPTVLCAELALHPVGKVYARKAIQYVITRPDQMYDLVSYINTVAPKAAKSLKCLRNGINDVMTDFDEYQLSKYKGTGAVKLRDIVLLFHPKPEDEDRAKLYRRILDDELAIPVTWETQISSRGNKASVWEELVAQNNLPYMAMLRNLRNILEANVSVECIEKVVATISSPERVAKSKQLPFRFMSAYREISGISSQYSNRVLGAIHDAMAASVINMPTFDGYTFTSADNSGSMSQKVSGKSTVTCADIANFMQALFISKTEDATASVFGDTFKVVNGRKSDIMGNARRFASTQVGCSTNGWLVFKHLIDNKLIVDRVVIFTDCQLYDSIFSGCTNHWSSASFDDYVRKYRNINPNVWVYVVNLAGYGTSPCEVKGRNVYISGFSEKIFDVMYQTERGTSSLIDEIEKTGF